MMTLLHWILGLLLAFVLLKGTVLWLQPRLAFHPEPENTPPPRKFQAFAVRASDGVRITGWHTSMSPDGPVLMYFCGNAGNLADRALLLGNFAERGAQVIAFNYRGTGESGGSPTEEGVYRDAQAVYEYLTGERNVDPARVVLWGHSIGGAVACRLASRNPCAGLVLESTFRSARVMANRMIPILPVGFLLTYRFDNETLIRQLKIPVFFIHGRDDRVVPPSDSQHLYTLVSGDKDLWLVENSGHNDIHEVEGKRFYDRVTGFAQRVTRAWDDSLSPSEKGRGEGRITSFPGTPE